MVSRAAPRVTAASRPVTGISRDVTAASRDVTAAGRRVRLLLTLVVGCLLLAGTLFGQDGDFPFGPFRMYATRDDPNGPVSWLSVQAVDSTGRVLALPDSATGLRRAEIEGQSGRLVRDSALLGDLSRAHDRLHPGEPAYDQVRVVLNQSQLRDSRPEGAVRSRVLVSWTRP